MMKVLTTMLLAFLLAGGAHRISTIESKGPWIYLYVESGYRYKSLLVSNVGEVVGYGSTFFVSRKDFYIYLYDAEGNRYKSLLVSNVGEVVAVTDNSFSTRKDFLIYTWDKKGNKIGSRRAK